jgi:Tfp pilus assembly protein PilF
MVAFLAELQRTAVLVAGGRFEEARAPAEELVSANPGSYEALWMLAEVERRTGRPARAEELYRRALAIDPAKGDALIGLGQLAKARGDLAGARDLFARATGDPTSFGAHLNLAVAELDGGDAARAREILEAAEPRFPYLAKIPYLLAAIHLRERRLDDARAAVERALALQPDDPSARALQARLDELAVTTGTPG